MMYAIIALLLGMLLGQRFKVLILVPTTLFIALSVPATEVMQGTSLRFGLLAGFAATMALQLGYVCGVGIFEFLSGHRPSAPPETSQTSMLRRL
jgi:hypothetical protein